MKYKDNKHTSFTLYFLAFFYFVFAASTAQARNVTFSWTANTEPVDGYRLYYKTGTTGGSPYNGTGATEGASPVTTGNVTTFTLSGLSDSETYFFVLTAVAGSLESDYSAELLLDPLPDQSAPGITVTFSWLPNEETNLAGYKIHYGTTSGSYSTTIDMGNPAQVDGRIQGEINGLEEGVTYYFAATAYNNKGQESDYSTEIVWTASSQSGGEPPTAADSDITTSEDSAITGTVTASNDGGSAITYHVQQDVSQGVLLLETGNGNFTYTPNANYAGTDSFTFLGRDDNGDSNIATVHITITPANDAPVAQSSSSTTSENSAVNGQLQAQDPDNDPLTYSRATNPAHGTATVNSDGAFTYTPSANYSGMDSFTFTVNDGLATSTPATVSITITAVNDPPTATDAAFTVTEDSTLNEQLQADDPDGDPLTYSALTEPLQGTLTVHSSGSFNYTPDTNATGSDSFTFQVSDGQFTSEVATVSITITSANDPPTVEDVAITINEDSPASGQLTGQDPEGDSLTYTALSNPARGTLSFNPSGTFTYTPDANITGTDSFTYQASDGQATSDPATVTITISKINDPPTVSNLTLSATEGIPANGQLQAQDPDGDTLSYAVVAAPAWGSLDVNTSGTFIYTADTGAAESDSFTFQASDGQATSLTGTVSITIQPDTGVTATFSWLPNTEADLTGYNLYYGTASRIYDTTLDVGNPVPINGRIQAEIEGLTKGITYYFAVTAYNAAGEESDYSTEVVWTASAQTTPPIKGNLTGIFGDTADSNHVGTLADTFTNANDTTYSTSDQLSTWSWSSPSPHKPANTIIIKADLSALAQDILVTEAKLYLYQTSSHGEAFYDNSVHKITGINPTIDQVTGNNAFNGGPWTPVPEGTTSNNVPLGLADIAIAEDTQTLDNQAGYKIWTVTRMVQDWASDPAANYGLLISGVSTATETGRTFASSENENAAFRPKLVIDYIKKPATPSVISAEQVQ